MSKFYEDDSKFHELNNLASQCAILEFDEKQGLQPDNIAKLLGDFKEVIENAIGINAFENVYDNSTIEVISLHVGDDPAFLCYLGTKSLTKEEAEEVYNFLMEDPVDEWEN